MEKLSFPHVSLEDLGASFTDGKLRLRDIQELAPVIELVIASCMIDLPSATILWR